MRVAAAAAATLAESCSKRQPRGQHWSRAALSRRYQLEPVRSVRGVNDASVTTARAARKLSNCNKRKKQIRKQSVFTINKFPSTYITFNFNFYWLCSQLWHFVWKQTRKQRVAAIGFIYFRAKVNCSLCKIINRKQKQSHIYYIQIFNKIQIWTKWRLPGEEQCAEEEEKERQCC